MNILYAITALGVGGAENLLMDVCAAMAADHNITVVFFRNKRVYEAQMNALGIETIFVDYEKTGFAKSVNKIRKIIKQKNIEIVHTHLPLADTIGRTAALTVFGVQVFTTLHLEPRPMGRALFSRLFILFNKVTVNLFRRASLIAISKTIKEMTMRSEGIRCEKIDILYNFIDTDNPKKSLAGFSHDLPIENKYVMIIMARLTKIKGHAVLFAAMEKLVHNHGMDDLFLLILGEGEEMESLERAAEHMKIAGHIHFAGATPNVYDYLKLSDLFVLPSEIEGFSLAVLEAHFCKVPVLASNIPSTSEELREGLHGVLFEMNDAEDLARKIIAIRAGEYDLNTFVQKGYDFCASLTTAAHIKELTALYTSRLGKS